MAIFENPENSYWLQDYVKVIFCYPLFSLLQITIENLAETIDLLEFFLTFFG